MFDLSILGIAAGGLIAVAGLAYLYGRRAERNRVMKRRLAATVRASEVEDDVARRTPEQRRKDLRKWGPGAAGLFLLLLAACVTPSGDFCDIAKPIRLTEATVAIMTDDEVTQALAHNEKLRAECGVQP